LEEVAFGWFNLKPDELDELTPREFKNKLAGFEKYKELQSRESWEIARQIVSTLLSPHTKKGQSINPKKLWPFSWDRKQKKAEKMSDQRLEYIEAKYKKIQGNG
jgi:hypothetical protein|tara:strand:- start:921 stop:1232 length:312 start_codon:yes stop_codon:yes gene_type:complete